MWRNAAGPEAISGPAADARAVSAGPVAPGVR
jgi:hypothetical protein